MPSLVLRAGRPRDRDRTSARTIPRVNVSRLKWATDTVAGAVMDPGIERAEIGGTWRYAQRVGDRYTVEVVIAHAADAQRSAP